MPSRIRNLLGRPKPGQKSDNEAEPEENLEQAILQEDQQEDFEKDRSILDDGAGVTEKRVQKEAEKEVQTAAKDSLKKLHKIQMGRCPKCGEHLRRHLFASICDSCGWHTFDAPREGPVRVHLKSGTGVVEGERCYRVQTGAVLVLRGDLVVAQVPKDSVGWIEYIWSEEEVEQRHKNVLERSSVRCAWCNSESDPEKDGFHLVQIAFGTSQERYCFCSDKCYEAFRKMYPARVHRNCYERNCSDCNLCVKRYEDEGEGVHLLAKDFLRVKQLKKK